MMITPTALWAIKVRRIFFRQRLSSVLSWPHIGAVELIANIQDTRAMLKSISLDQKVPVGNSDAESYFNTGVLSAIDYGVRLFLYL
jgi:hypothetical protein